MTSHDLFTIYCISDVRTNGRRGGNSGRRPELVDSVSLRMRVPFANVDRGELLNSDPIVFEEQPRVIALVHAKHLVFFQIWMNS